MSHPANDPATRCPDCGAGHAELIPAGKLVICCVCGRIFEPKPEVPAGALPSGEDD